LPYIGGVMSRTATYYTIVTWKGEHWGHVVMGNGPEMDFSAPPDAHGHPGVLTPEDAFVGPGEHRGQSPWIRIDPLRLPAGTSYVG
jgi:hypothetical protein